jgi:hypothetical protein
MVLTGEKGSTRRKVCPNAILPTHLIRIGLGLNPGLCGKNGKFLE